MKYLQLKMIMTFITLSIIGNGQGTNFQIEAYDFKSNSNQIVKAEMGKFSVPENRSVLNSRKITLHFVRFKSTNPNPGNPIVYLAGGPGGSGINTAKGNRFELFMALREVGDVIAFDQRGTGLSNQIPNCPYKAEFALAEPGTIEIYNESIINAANKCISFWKREGISIEGYNTIENANDLEDLRKVLGAPKITLWGISYGSHLAFDFIKRYEESIDRVVLAGLEGPDHTIKLPQHNENFLEILQEKIQEDKEASIVYPELLKLMKEVLESLDNEPINTTYIDQRSGKELKVGISKFDVQLVTSYFLTKNPENSRQLPAIFNQMKGGDFSGIAQMVVMLKTYAGQIQAMPLVMDIMSGISKERWIKVKEQAESCLLGRSTNFPFPDVAFASELPDLGSSFRANPKTDIPALFFSGTLDGRTYIESANEIKRGFKNSSHIILDGAGHDMFMSDPKVKDLIIEFLKGKDIASQTILIDVPDFIISK